MPVTRRQIQLGAVPENFPEGTHMCLIYDNEAERRKAIAQFLAQGLAAGEQVKYFADTMTPDEVRAWLAEMNVKLPEKGQNGAFEVLSTESVYTPKGRFVPAEMLERIGGLYDAARKAGYPGARATGEMTWALKGIPGSEGLFEYEARINQIVEEHPTTAVCQYDARRFDGATLLKMLKVHPMMIVQGQVVRNPYYIRPEELFM